MALALNCQACRTTPDAVTYAALLRAHLAAALALIRVVPSTTHDDELDAFLRGVLSGAPLGDAAHDRARH